MQPLGSPLCTLGVLLAVLSSATAFSALRIPALGTRAPPSSFCPAVNHGVARLRSPLREVLLMQPILSGAPPSQDPEAHGAPVSYRCQSPDTPLMGGGRAGRSLPKWSRISS